MLHVLTYPIFILLFTMWLGYELKRPYDLKKHWLWIMGAIAGAIAGYAINHIYKTNTGNFFLHMSGGVSAVFLYIYTAKTLQLRFSFAVTTLLVFMFVSTLGVLNELMEYSLETLGVGIMSFDRHDTWRDFVANTAGFILAWNIYCLFDRRGIKKSRGSLFI